MLLTPGPAFAVFRLDTFPVGARVGNRASEIGRQSEALSQRAAAAFFPKMAFVNP